ncbi:MAG TPA: heme-binding domain-containing protein [Bryobacteraceae bacterium]|nr:heme-binding domain-containing protein [Bryobacteraceae bacterium]
MLRRILKWALIVFILIQFIPYGHNHTNPPVTAEPKWDSPGTRELFHRACFDCHSNQTVWLWYSYVAPVSWLVRNDVDGGRGHMNLSEWNRPQRHADHVAEQVKQGEMPLWYYLPLHPAARLSAAEKQALIEGAEKTLGPQGSDHDEHNEH